MNKFNKIFGFIVVLTVSIMAFCSVSFAATVGQQLTKAEAGWQRFDDSDKRFIYPNGKASGTAGYNKTLSIFHRDDSKKNAKNTEAVTFKFKGTKIRVYAYRGPDRATDSKIIIDGNVETMPAFKGGYLTQALIYEKTGLMDEIHTVKIISGTNGSYSNFMLDAIDIDESGELIDSNRPYLLSVRSANNSITLRWDTVLGATSYNIKRTTTEGSQYTTIATTKDTNYTDTTAVNGVKYYYVVSAVSSTGESENSNEGTATIINPDVTLEVTSVDKAKVGDHITANVVIHNAVNICAEDIRLAFDTSRLEYISAVGEDGIKIYKESEIADGIKRYITASLGKSNAANGDKILLKLTFKAKAPGQAKIDITNGRIADNSTLEEDVKEENCGQKLILIEPTISDVNRSGEYTLLDLAIDAWYYGCAVSDTDTSKYDADQDGNGTIDDVDLSKIVSEMLSNTNYLSNK